MNNKHKNSTSSVNNNLKLFTPLAAVKHWAERDPDRLLLTFVSIEKDIFAEENRTAQELLYNSMILASALADAGIRKGDRLALVMRNHPEFIEAMLASEILGTIFVPIDVRVQPERLAFMLKHTDCRGAIVSEEGLERIYAIKEWPKPLEWAWVINSEKHQSRSVTPLKKVLKSIDRKKVITQKVEPRPLSDPMQLLFTSGTTGNPKAILSKYHRFATVGALHTHLGLTSDDRPYTGLSLSHANAQLISLGYSLTLGLSLVISRTFTKSKLWDIVAHYECTTFNLLGGMATALFSEPPSPRDRQHNVRFVLSAGMPASMWKEFEERFNVKIFEFYATAEGGLTMNPPGVGPIGSIGKPLAGTQCEILNEENQSCPPFTIGEICFRNTSGKVDPVIYYKNPEASEKKTRGGWFRSGDYGYKDENGWVYFSYRKGGSVRKNGEFIIVEDMATALAKHPDINDVYVYGVPLPNNSPGEKTVIATIVLSANSSLDIKNFLFHVRKVIGQGPYPDYFHIIDQIPKTASEKPIERFMIQYLNTGKGIIFSRTGNRVNYINTNK